MVLSLQHWLESEAPSATTWLSKVVHNCWLCSFRPCSKFAKGFQPLQRSWKYFRQSRQLCSVRKVRLVKNVATYCNGCCLMQTFQWNYQTNWKDDWSRNGWRKKLGFEMFGFCLMRMQCSLLCPFWVASSIKGEVKQSCFNLYGFDTLWYAFICFHTL